MRTADMTSGDSRKQILFFFLPLLAGNLFQQFYSLADSIIVGKGIGDLALAAVGASGSLHFFIFGFAIGLTHGFGILFSQAIGAKNQEKLEEYVAAAICLGAAISAVLAAVTLLFLPGMFSLMQTPADIYPQALSYFRIIIAGIPVTILGNLAIRLLQAAGDSRSSFIAMSVSSVINIVLDLLFVFVLHAGVEGAAGATVAAQLCSLLYCAASIRRQRIVSLPAKRWSAAAAHFLPMVRLGIPVAVMNSVTALGTILLQYFVNRMGSVCVAAYSVCMKYAGLFEQVGIAVGLSVLTFVGQNTGAGNRDRIRTGVKQAAVLSVFANIPIAVLEIFFPAALAALMVSSPEVIAQCRIFLPWLGVFLFPLGWLFVFRNACQGMGNTVLPMLSGVVEVLMRLIFGWLGRGSFTGIAIAEISAWTGAWLMLWVSYRYVWKCFPGRDPAQ